MSHLMPRSGATETRHSCYSPFAVAEAKLWVIDEHSKRRCHDNACSRFEGEKGDDEAHDRDT